MTESSPGLVSGDADTAERAELLQGSLAACDMDHDGSGGADGVAFSGTVQHSAQEPVSGRSRDEAMSPSNASVELCVFSLSPSRQERKRMALEDTHAVALDATPSSLCLRQGRPVSSTGPRRQLF